LVIFVLIYNKLRKPPNDFGHENFGLIRPLISHAIAISGDVID